MVIPANQRRDVLQTPDSEPLLGRGAEPLIRLIQARAQLLLQSLWRGLIGKSQNLPPSPPPPLTSIQILRGRMENGPLEGGRVIRVH
ncbi:hypothetical protein NQZ68_021778 [Dissostichus eleginoides]|nr:hypothetical protein NQZ68_021778 [Dissostichus eleginoides]